MSKRIIIVDDAPIIRSMLKDILVQAGYEVVAECNNGKEAVDVFRDLKPDLMTMDIVMPEKDGIEAIRGNPEYRWES